jgi:hypothetical protein
VNPVAIAPGSVTVFLIGGHNGAKQEFFMNYPG